MKDELDRARQAMASYPGDEIRVLDAVSIMSRVLGLKIHILTPEEVPLALERAKALIIDEKVREGPFEVKNEIVRASLQHWPDLSAEARALVGSIWGSEANLDLVMTMGDPVQPKEKMLDLLENLLEQKAILGLGSRRDAP